MKQLLMILLASLLLLLCACGAPAAGESDLYEPAAGPSAAAETAAQAPVLSPGASSFSQRADRFGTAPDGTLITSLIRTDGISCVYDLLPEDIGYVASFIAAEDGIYAAVKEQYFTLDPAALWFFPYEGEPQLLADGISSDGTFVMTEDVIFYVDAEDGTLRTWPGSDTASAPEGELRLLDADAGFIYYEKEDGVWRNDSTLGAEAFLFSPASGCVRTEDGLLYDLIWKAGADGASIEKRDTAGKLLDTVVSGAAADHFLVSGGKLYIPAGTSVEIRSCDDGSLLSTVPLPESAGYCLLLCAADDAFYFESMIDGEFVLCRAADGTAEVLGPELLFF